MVRSRSRNQSAVCAPGASSNGVGWNTPRVGRADKRTKHAARSESSVAGRLVLHVTKRAGGARHGTRTRRLRRFEAATTDKASVCARSVGQWRGVEHAASWLRRQPRQARHSAQCVLYGRSAGSPPELARAPRATRLERNSYDDSKPQLPTGRGVGANEPRPSARGGARHELAVRTTAPSAQRAERVLCGQSAGSTPGLARARRAPRD